MSVDVHSVLVRHASTDEDREAALEGPRPGVWADEAEADLRALTQDETDAVIRSELAEWGARPELDEIVNAAGGHREVIVPIRHAPCFRVKQQRGGIDSHPLVRILARRAWGDRDRQWFALRGVRQGEQVGGSTVMVATVVPRVALAWRGDIIIGHALHDARPGEALDVEPGSGSGARRCVVTDRVRQPSPEDADVHARSMEAGKCVLCRGRGGSFAADPVERVITAVLCRCMMVPPLPLWARVSPSD